MKKQLLSASLCVLGALGASADTQVYVTPKNASFTDVTNEGIAVGYSDQCTPYFLWNPFTGEVIPIGGISAGNGLGGTPRITADGKYVFGLNPYDKVQMTSLWTKALYPDFSDYKITGFMRSGKQICLAIAVSPEGKSTVLESGGQCNSWRSNDSGNVLENTVITAGTWAGPFCYFVGCEGGRFFSSKGNTSWLEQKFGPAGFSAEVKAITAMDFSKMGVKDSYTDGCVGYETTDGGYGVFYAANASSRYVDFSESEGVEGVPTCIRYVSDPADEEYKRFYLTTRDGKIQETSDKGATWYTLFDAQMPLYKIAFSTPEKGVAISDEVIFLTEDAGDTWTKVTVFPEEINPLAADSPRHWNDVLYIGDRIVLAGNQGTLYVSEDNGKTFTAQPDIIDEAGDSDLLALDYSADWELLSIGSEQGTFFSKKESGSIENAIAVSRYDVEADEWTPYDNLGTFQVAYQPVDGCVYGISEDGGYATGIIYSEVSETNHNIQAYAGLWNAEGRVIRMPNMFEDVEDRPCSCRANAVSNDGSVVVGWQDRMGPWMGCVWRRQEDGSYKQTLLLSDPNKTVDDIDFSNFDEVTANTMGEGLAVSPNGKWIGGAGGKYANSKHKNAWLWSEETGYIDLPIGGRPMEISDDGQTVAGMDSMGFSGWVWTRGEGTKSFPGSVYAMSPNGRFVCGTQVVSTSEHYGYVADLRPEVEGVEEIEDQVAVSVYPNPVVSELHVDLPCETAAITVLNMQGAICAGVNATGTHSAIDLSSLPAGLYMVNVKTPAGTRTFKVIKK